MVYKPYVRYICLGVGLSGFINLMLGIRLGLGLSGFINLMLGKRLSQSLSLLT